MARLFHVIKDNSLFQLIRTAIFVNLLKLQKRFCCMMRIKYLIYTTILDEFGHVIMYLSWLIQIDWLAISLETP